MSVHPACLCKACTTKPTRPTKALQLHQLTPARDLFLTIRSALSSPLLEANSLKKQARGIFFSAASTPEQAVFNDLRRKESLLQLLFPLPHEGGNTLPLRPARAVPQAPTLFLQQSERRTPVAEHPPGSPDQWDEVHISDLQ